MQTTTLVRGIAFGEGPRWRDDKLWFSDIHGFRVYHVDLAGSLEPVVDVPHQPSGLGWTTDGRLLVVSMVDRRLLRLDPTGLTEVADLSSYATHHCNDMLVDSQGRAYVGNFGWDIYAPDGGSPVNACIVRVDPDGSTHVAADDLTFPNGTVLTPDGKTLVVGETFAARLTAFDVAADGSLSNRRVWAALDGFVPDGICLDAEGAIWVASPLTSEVVRVHEGGRVSARIPLAQQAFACMLGGPERKHLFICTAEDSTPERCRAEHTGRIEVVEVEVPGAGWP